MKTKFYILFVLILSVSVAQAQSKDSKDPKATQATEVNTTVNESASVETTKFISPAELKANIARTNSDIRVYFNRVKEKKVDNIKLMFPKIYKEEKA